MPFLVPRKFFYSASHWLVTIFLYFPLDIRYLLQSSFIYLHERINYTLYCNQHLVRDPTWSHSLEGQSSECVTPLYSAYRTLFVPYQAFNIYFYKLNYIRTLFMEKAMATHSSVLAWRIPGMVEPGGLLSVGSHRVGHDWSDLAAAAATAEYYLRLSKFWPQCKSSPHPW